MFLKYNTRPCDRVLRILDHIVLSLLLNLAFIIRWKLVIFTNGFKLTGYLRWICIIRKNSFSNNVIRDDSTKKCASNAVAIALPDKRLEIVTLS